MSLNSCENVAPHFEFLYMDEFYFSAFIHKRLYNMSTVADESKHQNTGSLIVSLCLCVGLRLSPGVCTMKQDLAR